MKKQYSAPTEKAINYLIHGPKTDGTELKLPDLLKDQMQQIFDGNVENDFTSKLKADIELMKTTLEAAPHSRFPLWIDPYMKRLDACPDLVIDGNSIMVTGGLGTPLADHNYMAFTLHLLNTISSQSFQNKWLTSGRKTLHNILGLVFSGIALILFQKKEPQQA
jgi:hypothetical protein